MKHFLIEKALLSWLVSSQQQLGRKRLLLRFLLTLFIVTSSWSCLLGQLEFHKRDWFRLLSSFLKISSSALASFKLRETSFFFPYFSIVFKYKVRGESHIDFRTQHVIMTFAGEEGKGKIQKSYRIWKFMYCNLVLLYLSNYRWKKIKLWACVSIAVSSLCLSAHCMYSWIHGTINPPLVSSSRKKYRDKEKENQIYPIIVFFTVCLNVTFTNNWLNQSTW